ncbi:MULTISPECIES: hypothetical protein [unclassified Bacillus (in: firmicutes)]|uniref:hypothetical protein n=1 Tax=unclassified Bacillus (in: firmicutes) TaxID=185979 RepID=UPI001BE869BC|nr:MULTISPECIES: hypothetical protein [unclassified Bacillus (in: firmicutes)]MBT2615141.1 hypothetical protein [Bacillus sp. ISL-78]MBT2628246.1 hypothetical protein [Bacillus sp. ISL-101]
MNINIKVYLHSKGTRFLQSGSISVPNLDFKKDPDWTAAIAAYKWIEEIKINFAASEDFRIDQVIYNEDIDITDLVKKVKPII